MIIYALVYDSNYNSIDEITYKNGEVSHIFLSNLSFEWREWLRKEETIECILSKQPRYEVLLYCDDDAN